GFDSTFVAPASPGVYEFSWRIKSAGGNVFGDPCSAAITVSGSSPSNKADGSGSKPPSGGTSVSPQDPVPTEVNPNDGSKGMENKTKKSLEVTAKQPVEGSLSLAERIQLTSASTKLGISLATIIIILVFVLRHRYPQALLRLFRRIVRRLSSVERTHR
ncbi:MAG TPA: hypothetical protein VFM05_06980, partial [Candidatus Saccharimonadales bacterium]|nr:hypothetical protein [Candidatus Saccharimonadales bacterium]